MNSQDPFVVFNNNIERASDFLMLAELKEFRTGVSIPVIEQFRPIRQIVKKWASEIYIVGLPQVLVYSVSCLEAYLKDYYYFTLKKIGREYQETRFWWNDILQKYEDLVGDIFEENEELLFDVEEIREKRHVVIHNGGIVNQNAIDNITRSAKKRLSPQKAQEKSQQWESMTDKNLPLAPKTVENDIETIKKFVKLIQQKTSHLEKKIISQ